MSKKIRTILLEAEYSQVAARQQAARERHHALIRKQARAQAAAPIENRDTLSDAVAQLAGAWGLKKKQSDA